MAVSVASAPLRRRVEREHGPHRPPCGQPLPPCLDLAQHLRRLGGGVGPAVAFGGGAEAAVPGDVAERDREFRAGREPVQPVRSEPPRVQSSPGRRRASRPTSGKKAVSREQSPHVVHPPPPAPDDPALSPPLPPDRVQRCPVFVLFGGVESPDTCGDDPAGRVRLKERPPDRSDAPVQPQHTHPVGPVLFSGGCPLTPGESNANGATGNR